MKRESLERKLKSIVDVGKPKTIKVDGKNYYISRKVLNECKKEGGILPLLTLIPLIAGGVGAAGAVAGGAAGIAKAVNDKKADDAELAEQQRHNREMEKAVGRGLKNFVRALNLENEGKKAVKEFFKNLSDVIQIEPAKNGSGLYLNPYRK